MMVVIPLRAFGLSLIFKRTCTHGYGNMTWNDVADDIIRSRLKYSLPVTKQPQENIPTSTDVLLIGAGLYGNSIAYWLRKKARNDLKITLIEGDNTTTTSATVLSIGGLRHQFSLAENVSLSMFMTDNLRNLEQDLTLTADDPVDFRFYKSPYLFLAASSEDAEFLEGCNRTQRSVGAKNILLSRSALQERFPFMDMSDVHVGSLGGPDEGMIDPYTLLCALREWNVANGATIVKSQVSGFQVGDSGGNISGIKIRPNVQLEERSISIGQYCINAAGAGAGFVNELLHKSVTSVPDLNLPIIPRKRFVYVVHCPTAPVNEMPMLVDSTGFYIRREGQGGMFACGKSPNEEQDNMLDHSNDQINYEFYEDEIWPALATRIPAFNASKMKSAWAGFYDYCKFDQNAIIDFHPSFNNLFICAGFSGHGLQHGLGVGFEVAEKLLNGKYRNINLDIFTHRRIAKNLRLMEPKFIV